jgi:hypothetical protein
VAHAEPLEERDGRPVARVRDGHDAPHAEAIRGVREHGGDRLEGEPPPLSIAGEREPELRDIGGAAIDAEAAVADQVPGRAVLDRELEPLVG